MSKQTKEFRKLSVQQLKEKKKELEFLLMGANSGVHPLTAITNRPKIRKSVSRLNTLIQEKDTLIKEKEANHA